MDKKTLEVGDVLYAKSGYTKFEYRRIVIERVTNTQAIGNGYKFKRNLEGNGWIIRIGGSDFSRTIFELETEELKTTYNRYKLLHYLKFTIDFEKLSDETLTTIYQTIKNSQQ
jgi:hypothetical protein